MTNQHSFIDMHTHLFTARYLPLHGILLSAGIKNNFVARGLAGLANSITGKSDFDSDHEDPLQEGLVQALLDRDADKLLAHMSSGARLLIKRYQRNIKRSRHEKEELREALSALDDLTHGLGRANDHAQPFSTRLLHKAPIPEHSMFGGDVEDADDVDDLIAMTFALAGEEISTDSLFEQATHLELGDAFAKGTSARAEKFGLTKSQLGNFRQLLLFVGVMALSERNKFRVLERDYDKGKPANGKDASYYVGVLMDMQEAYTELHGANITPPYFPFKEQMTRMKSLAQEAGGRLISFGAVDPFRPDWREYVEFGQTQGIGGYKIYCPLGYRPIDVHPSDYETQVGPDSDDRNDYLKRAKEPVQAGHAQRAVGKIISYFSQNGLRLYTHCTPIGFQAQKGYGIYSDPGLWRRAMNDHGAENLRLYLAHAGGATKVDWNGWAAKEKPDFEKSFAYRAIQLAQDYDNVYLGLGNIFEFIDAGPDNIMWKRLAHYLREDAPAGANHHFRTKVCFGTDWSMPAAIGQTRAYLNAFHSFFEREALDDFAYDFFEGNARRYLGLDIVS